MKRKYYRKRIIAFLIVLSITLSGTTFAYWANYVEGTQEQYSSTLQVGYGKGVETVISISPDSYTVPGYLVPQGQVNNSIGLSLESIELNYDLLWKEQQLITQIDGEEILGEIEVEYIIEIITANSVEPLNIEEYQNIYNLVHITPTQDNQNIVALNNQTPTSLSYTVTMDEPNNKTEYELIANSTINIYITFTIDTNIFDLNIDFTKTTFEKLYALHTVSPQIDNWNLYSENGLVNDGSNGQRIIYFPINQDEYTITVNAKLNDIDNLSGGYGIYFDTYFNNDNSSQDSGYIFQFDRGYSSGEMIVRPREFGSERNPTWRVWDSITDAFPSKYTNPEWWVTTHQITIEVTNINTTTRQASFFIDDIYIGKMTYENVISNQQIYVGFRGWNASDTFFYDLKVQ